MDPSEIHFSIVVPTCGRPTLYRTLASILDAGYADGDEVLVVGDGRCVEAERISDNFVDRMRISYTEIPPNHMYGHAQRNHAIGVARKTHLSFMDDDDAYPKDALRQVRSVVAQNPDRIHIFRMVARARRLAYDFLWRAKEIYVGNVGTPMYVLPNRREWLGTWGNRYEGDFDFIQSTLEKFPGGLPGVIWREEVIAEIY